MSYPAVDVEINSIFDSPNMTGTPERRLLMAILERALLDFVGNDAKECEESREWIFDALPNDSMLEFSFAWICQQLDLDITDIRNRIKAMPRRGTSRIAPWYITKGYTAKEEITKLNKNNKIKKNAGVVSFLNKQNARYVS